MSLHTLCSIKKKGKTERPKKKTKNTSSVQGVRGCDKLFVSMADLSITLMLDQESNNLSAANTDIFRGAGERLQAQKMGILLRRQTERAQTELLPKSKKTLCVSTLSVFCVIQMFTKVKP